MKLTNKEQAWLKRFEKTMGSAPKSLRNKIWSYTIGDDYIVLYDKDKFDEYYKENPEPRLSLSDQYELVDRADCRLGVIDFPFPIESTAG